MLESPESVLVIDGDPYHADSVRYSLEREGLRGRVAITAAPERGGLIRGRFHPAARGRSNKRMHATADTSAVNFMQSLGAAREARR